MNDMIKQYYILILFLTAMNFLSQIQAEDANDSNNYESFILEHSIDPYQYFLGPGDQIGISITTSSDITKFMKPYITTITPTGDVWIPDIGSIQVNGQNIIVDDGFTL